MNRCIVSRLLDQFWLRGLIHSLVLVFSLHALAWARVEQHLLDLQHYFNFTAEPFVEKQLCMLKRCSQSSSVLKFTLYRLIRCVDSFLWADFLWLHRLLFDLWPGTVLHRCATWIIIHCCSRYSQCRFIRVNSCVYHIDQSGFNMAYDGNSYQILPDPFLIIGTSPILHSYSVFTSGVVGEVSDWAPQGPQGPPIKPQDTE